MLLFNSVSGRIQAKWAPIEFSASGMGAHPSRMDTYPRILPFMPWVRSLCPCLRPSPITEGSGIDLRALLYCFFSLRRRKYRKSQSLLLVRNRIAQGPTEKKLNLAAGDGLGA